VKSRRITIVASAVLALVVGCGKKPPAKPDKPTGPTQAWVGQTTEHEVVTTATGGIRYIMDWGDDSKRDTTKNEKESGVKVKMPHRWTKAGDFNLKVMAFLAAKEDKASEWSEPAAITVLPNDAPLIDSVVAPGYTAKEAETRFTVFARDPDNDSISVKIRFGDGGDTTSSVVASPCVLELTHVYARAETVYVKAVAQDVKGAVSDTTTIGLVVGPAGGVIAWWMNHKDDEGTLNTSPVLAPNGTVDCIYGGCADADPPKFYSIKVSDFRPYRSAASTSTKFTDNEFNGHAAYCQATNHIIVGSEEGELYALKAANLSVEWRYPGTTREESLTGQSWGAPAISGNKIYIGNESDAVFYFIDNGATVSLIAPYALNSSMVDAPVIDASGNVFFGTESGYLYKFGSNLDFQWSKLLIPNKAINGVVIGKDGVVYCTSEGEQPSDPARLYAVNPDGSLKWPTPGYTTTYGLGTRPAVDADGHIYLGTQVGRFYKFNKDDGTALWRHFYGSAEFNTTPIVVQGGYLYAQNTEDVLYCADRATGDTIWVCDCPKALPQQPPRARNMELFDFDANPTITADGNIVVAGEAAVYLVKGYPERPLDTSAPWPKWQKNLFNTGR